MTRPKRIIAALTPNRANRATTLLTPASIAISTTMIEALIEYSHQRAGLMPAAHVVLVPPSGEGTDRQVVDRGQGEEEGDDQIDPEVERAPGPVQTAEPGASVRKVPTTGSFAGSEMISSTITCAAKKTVAIRFRRRSFDSFRGSAPASGAAEVSVLMPGTLPIAGLAEHRTASV